jgi:hypothetical protein
MHYNRLFFHYFPHSFSGGGFHPDKVYAGCQIAYAEFYVNVDLPSNHSEATKGCLLEL